MQLGYAGMPRVLWNLCVRVSTVPRSGVPASPMLARGV